MTTRPHRLAGRMTASQVARHRQRRDHAAHPHQFARSKIYGRGLAPARCCRPWTWGWHRAAGPMITECELAWRSCG